jgi:hypothetical protein
MASAARLTIDDQPAFGAGTKRYTVACDFSTTRLWLAPGRPVELADRVLVSLLLQRHTAECGRCDLAKLWQDHGDLALKAAVERAAQLRERRN